MAVVFITPTELTVGSANAWTDVDVSGETDYPSGCTGVILQCVNNTSASSSQAFGVRKNGSTDNRIENLNNDFYNFQMFISIGVDGSGIFEAYVGSTTEVDIYLCGYYTTEATFNTNASDVSTGTTGSWVDVDLGVSDNAALALLEITSDTDFTGREFGVRMNGSTDARNTGRPRQHCGCAVGVDGSEIFEQYISHTDVNMFVVGYMNADITANTNAVDLSYATPLSSWTDLTALSSGAIGGVIEVENNASAQRWGLRYNGSSQNIQSRQSGHKTMGLIECDGSQLCEGWIESTSADFYEVAIFTAASGNSGSISESASSSGSFSASSASVASLSGDLTATAVLSAIAAAASYVSADASATDGLGAPAAAIGLLSQSATSGDLLSAMSNASSAFAAGAAAGETWTAYSSALAELISSGASADEISAASSTAQEATLSAATTAAEAFSSAVQAIALLSESAAASDAFSAVVAAIASFSGSLSATDGLSGESGDSRSGTLSADASSSDLYGAASDIVSSITEMLSPVIVADAISAANAVFASNASAAALFSAGSDTIGRMVVGAIALNAATQGALAISEAMGAGLSLDTAIDGDVTLH